MAWKISRKKRNQEKEKKQNVYRLVRETCLDDTLDTSLTKAESKRMFHRNCTFLVGFRASINKIL